jgi:4-carboxymuconolactone decarboxylase
MTRVPAYTISDTLTGDALEAFNRIKESRGHVVGVFSVLFASPKVANLLGELGAFMRFESSLPTKVREVTICTALSECDGQFEWGPHLKAAKEAGVSDTTAEAIAQRVDLIDVPEDERNIINFTREVIRNNSVSDKTYKLVSNVLDTKNITELTALIGYYTMVSCILNTFEVAAGENQPRLPKRDAVSEHGN